MTKLTSCSSSVSMLLVWIGLIVVNNNGFRFADASELEFKFDLLVHTTYVNVGNEDDDGFSLCSSSCDRSNCVTYPIEVSFIGVCYPTLRGSDMYTRVLANKTTGEEEGFCQTSYANDALCQEGVHYRSRECVDRFSFTCNNTHPNSLSETQDWSLQENFCIESQVPVPPLYVTPMVELRAYRNETECRGETANYPPITSLQINDASLCKSASTFGTDKGQTFHCDGDRLIVDYFSDSTCSKQDSDLTHTEHVVGDCTPQLERQKDAGDFRFDTNCGSVPNYYCKDFAVAGLGTRMGSSAASCSPSLFIWFIMLCGVALLVVHSF